MTAFGVATDSAFADPHHAQDALYRSGGVGAGRPVRVVISAPDGFASFGERRYVVETSIVQVRRWQVPEPVRGDTFTVGPDTYEVQGAPVCDPMRLVWNCEAVRS